MRFCAALRVSNYRSTSSTATSLILYDVPLIRLLRRLKTYVHFAVRSSNNCLNIIDYRRCASVFTCIIIHCVSEKNAPAFKLKQCSWKLYAVWVKKSPLQFSDIFPKRLGIFNQFFTHLLHAPFYTRLQIFIQLSPTLTKLCHTKRDHTFFDISLELNF